MMAHKPVDLATAVARLRDAQEAAAPHMPMTISQGIQLQKTLDEIAGLLRQIVANGGGR